jgi:hypothetical protein
MSKLLPRHGPAALAAALALALALSGCGGGGGDEPAAARTSDVTASAQQSVGGLFTYLGDLIANRTGETTEPVLVGDAVLPTSESAEPN